jgi:predicted short-subunit dehydrogenase-like oxidoreductase (DUF2520 family)
MNNSSHTNGGEPIGIAGTGRMAKALGALLRANGFRVGAVAGRSSDACIRAAGFVHADAAVSMRELPRCARCILIAVSDDAVTSVADELEASGLEGGIVLHTSGSAGPDALACLRRSNNSTGVLHPLQTVPTAERGIETLPGSTFACSGDDAAMSWAGELIEALRGRALAIDPERWQHYHAAAVMACNYHVTLVDAALELMENAGIGRGPALDALRPLIQATTDNVLNAGPEAALTGPVRRGDAGTIRRHLAALSTASEETRKLYVAAGRRTIALAKRAGLDRGAAVEIAAALGDLHA